MRGLPALTPQTINTATPPGGHSSFNTPPLPAGRSPWWVGGPGRPHRGCRHRRGDPVPRDCRCGWDGAGGASSRGAGGLCCAAWRVPWGRGGLCSLCWLRGLPGWWVVKDTVAVPAWGVVLAVVLGKVPAPRAGRGSGPWGSYCRRRGAVVSVQCWCASSFGRGWRTFFVPWVSCLRGSVAGGGRFSVVYLRSH